MQHITGSLRFHFFCREQVLLENSPFVFFGKLYNSIHVGSNGYITLGAGDFRFESTVGSRNPKAIGSHSQASFEATRLVATFVGIQDASETPTVTGRQLFSQINEQSSLEGGATHWDQPRISIWFQVDTLVLVHLKKRYRYVDQPVARARMYILPQAITTTCQC